MAAFSSRKLTLDNKMNVNENKRMNNRSNSSTIDQNDGKFPTMVFLFSVRSTSPENKLSLVETPAVAHVNHFTIRLHLLFYHQSNRPGHRRTLHSDLRVAQYDKNSITVICYRQVL